MMQNSYGTSVDKVELLQAMFHVHRSVTLSDVDTQTALSYINHIGNVDIDLSNPHIFLTFYVPEKNGYVAICNNCDTENSVTAIQLNERGGVENFLNESSDGSFSYIDLFELGCYELEDKPMLSDLPLTELQYTLYSNYLETYTFLKSN